MKLKNTGPHRFGQVAFHREFSANPSPDRDTPIRTSRSPSTSLTISTANSSAATIPAATDNASCYFSMERSPPKRSPKRLLNRSPMNNYLRNLWNEIDRLASNEPTVTFTIAAVVVLTVGFLCLRGNVIKR